ncbi:MAG: hypothetical protein QOJ65_868 [Fimbriimonadaceae bacterium]|jgi:hypothetical protein|nr:hypothetical protein [Fimbriimonadaceae bacterium]
MRKALQVLLSDVIDYAGLFPPAKLNVSDSVENYLRYCQGPEKWIVSRFVCSTGKLPELARELAEHPEEPLVPVTVVGQASTDRKTWEHALTHDSQAMNKFLIDAENHAEIEAFEIRAPDHEHLQSYIKDLHGFNDVDVFVELPWSPAMDESLSLLAESEWLNAKGRTGGLEASAFPTIEEVAGFVQQCAHLDLRFKLTAGLHHPLPRKDDASGGNMHGFLNILVALAQLHAHELNRREIEAILAEADPSAFAFSDDGVAYRGQKASMDDVAAAREVFVSYGSCSVEEPLEDLRKMGLLEGAISR